MLKRFSRDFSIVMKECGSQQLYGFLSKLKIEGHEYYWVALIRVGGC